MRTWILTAGLVTILAATARAAAAEYEYQIESAGGMLTNRHRHVAVDLQGGRVAIFGGFARSDAEILDLKTRTFRQVEEKLRQAEGKRPFGDFAGIGLGPGLALLVNGQQDCVFDSTREIFEPTLNTFTGAPVRWPGMAALPDGKIFLCGGYDAKYRPIRDCAVFDPATRQFTTVGKLALPRGHHSVNLLNDHEVLLGGGTGSNFLFQCYDSLEIFDLQTGRSRQLDTRLHRARANHAAVALADGRILFIGGYESKARREVGRSAELFDPAAGTMTGVGPLAVVRGSPLAARLPSGRVAVFGGADDLRLVELYCPADRQFVPGPLLIEPRREEFTVTRLADGRCVLIGGRANCSPEMALRGAEMFSETVRSNRPPADAAEPERRDRVALLTGQLGAADYRVRETATRELIAMGGENRRVLEKLLQDPDPEISERAAKILDALKKAGQTGAWCVELWSANGKLQTFWYDQFEMPEHLSREDSKLRPLCDALEKRRPERLILRFSSEISLSTQGLFLNFVGWTRHPSIQLGPPLPP